MNKWSIQKWSILVGILCLLIVALAVVSTLFSVKDVLYESFAAILGVVLTACVTVILLRGQTDTETEQSHTAKVFEEKLQIYKDFLNALCDALKDGVITKEEYVQLQFQFATITMHTKLVNARKVSDSVFNIINDLHDSKDGLSNKLMPELLNIVEVLRSELYDDPEKMSVDEKKELVFNFTEIQGSFEESAEEQPTINVETVDGEDNIKASINKFIANVNENLQSWAKSEDVKLDFDGDAALRITSPMIGSDTTKDYFRWVLANEISLGIMQNGLSDKAQRREIYSKAKQLGYHAVFSTNYGATIFPVWEERFLHPKTVGQNEYRGVLSRIIAQDSELVQSYANWIKDIYQKFKGCKLNHITK